MFEITVIINQDIQKNAGKYNSRGGRESRGGGRESIKIITYNILDNNYIYMSSFVDIYNGIINYKGSKIVIVIDQNNTPWFFAKQIAKILKYKNTNSIINKLVDNINKILYESIKEYSKYKYNVQDHTVFVNEYGMYELILG